MLYLWGITGDKVGVCKNSSSRYWKCFWNKWGFQYISKYHLYQLSPGSDLNSDWICTLRSRILIWTGIKYCLPALKHTSLKLSYPYHKQIWMRIKAKKVFPFQMLTGYERRVGVGGNASEQKGSWKYRQVTLQYCCGGRLNPYFCMLLSVFFFIENVVMWAFYVVFLVVYKSC